MIRFSTAGESHGEALIALISGLPAGVPVDLDFINRDLWRRQQGYGRGGRMKIETTRLTSSPAYATARPSALPLPSSSSTATGRIGKKNSLSRPAIPPGTNLLHRRVPATPIWPAL